MSEQNMDGNTQTANLAPSLQPDPQKKKTKKKTKKGLTERFVPGKTKCSAQGCDFKVMVRGTKTIQHGPNHVRIERSVRCTGPRRHTNTLVEIVKIK